jgi:hypothetical protein
MKTKAGLPENHRTHPDPQMKIARNNHHKPGSIIPEKDLRNIHLVRNTEIFNNIWRNCLVYFYVELKDLAGQIGVLASRFYIQRNDNIVLQHPTRMDRGRGLDSPFARTIFVGRTSPAYRT